MIADEIRVPDKKPDFQPILVYMMMAEPHVIDYSGTFVAPENPPQTLHFIGVIADKAWAVDMSEAHGPQFDALRLRLRDQFDVYLNLFCQATQRKNGDIGCAISYGVTVHDYDHAKRLPGFSPLCMWSGYQAPIPESPPKTVG